jgi:iron complex transport system permease protein
MRAGPALILLVFASVTVLALNLLAGPSTLDFSLARGSARFEGRELATALLSLRAARGLTAYLVGAALAVAGVLAQGLFRNPLASPDLLGTSAGASFAGKMSMLLLATAFERGHVGGLAFEAWLPVACLLGALAALLVLLALARRAPDAVALLLAGFLLSALFLGLGAFVTSLAQESWELGRAVIAFALGSVTGAGPRQVATIAPIAVIGTLAALAWSRPLDLLLSGEEEARVLGLDVARARRWLIIWIALLTAGAVAVGGNLGFVGLVVPHGARRLVGVAHRRLLPAAALGGGLFVLACDMLARALPSRTEIPLGVITDLVGAPLFLVLVMRSQRRLLHG